jgi:peptidoglycan hydrolase-like protein with peptidoglycan-binding domain
MAANTIPIYTKAANISWVNSLTTAVTAMTGVGATLLFTAGAEGSRVERIRLRALGTNVATVLRLFINNGSTPDTATNNALYGEITVAATTASAAAALLTTNEFPSTADTTAFPIVLPAGYRLYVTLGANVATGYDVIAIGADY